MFVIYCPATAVCCHITEDIDLTVAWIGTLWLIYGSDSGQRPRILCRHVRAASWQIYKKLISFEYSFNQFQLN